MTPAFRAPMRARDRDLAPGAGAEFGLARGLVGIGDALPVVPPSLAEAVLAATDRHGAKAGRMLAGFAVVPDGAFAWTRDTAGSFHLGRLSGPWRYDDSPAARAVGIHHVRPVEWLSQPVEPPPAVRATFARRGRNFQRIRDAETERVTARLFEEQRAA